MEYKCSRCGKCYVHKHKVVHFGDGRIMWKNNAGKFEPVIMEKGDWYNDPSPQTS